MDIAKTLAVLLYSLSACPSPAQSIMNLGSLPGMDASFGKGVSADGQVVVGYSQGVNGVRAFRWTPSGGIEELGGLPSGNWSMATGISADGNTIIGSLGTSDGPRAFLATSGSGLQQLRIPASAYSSSASAVNRDGTTIVGSIAEGSGGSAVMWRYGNADILGTLNGVYADALAVSLDGSVVAGSSEFGGMGNVAFRWTQSDGMQSIGRLRNHDVYSTAFGVNGDGTIIVGESGDFVTSRAFMWTPAQGMVDLGVLSGGWLSRAYSVSNAGLIVGQTTDATSYRAFIWSGEHGIVDLKSYLQAQNVDTSGWDSLYSADAISADGRFIVGSGTYEGRGVAFLVDLAPIPTPSTLAIIFISVATMARRNRS